MSTINYFIPYTLKKLPIWILWKLEKNNNKLTKVPYSAQYNGRAKSNDSSTWATYEKVRSIYNNNKSDYNGIGIMLSEKFKLIFIDIDHCFNKTGEFTQTAKDIFSKLHSQYIEISQSGNGLHIIMKGSIPKSYKNKDIEIYNKSRFCALTGNALVKAEPHYSEKELEDIYNTYKMKDPPFIKRTCNFTQINKNNDEYIIRKAIDNDNRILSLFNGKWDSLFPSHSEADAYLCIQLAFWTDRNPKQIDRIFRQSGLYRQKWEREDYRERTILFACQCCKESLTEYENKKRKEELIKYERLFLSEPQ